MEMTTLVTKLLGSPENVEPFKYLSPRLHRWMIFETQYFKVYLHHIYNEDLEVELRAYPGQLICFGFASSDPRNSAGTTNAVPHQAAWLVLIAKSSRQKERDD
jgi:hypothetical protein